MMNALLLSIAFFAVICIVPIVLSFKLLLLFSLEDFPKAYYMSGKENK